MTGLRLPHIGDTWYSPGTGGRTTPPPGTRWVRDGSGSGAGSVSSPTGAVPLHECAWLPSDGGRASVAGHNARSSGQAATVTPTYMRVRLRPSGLIRRRMAYTMRVMTEQTVAGTTGQ